MSTTEAERITYERQLWRSLLRHIHNPFGCTAESPFNCVKYAPSALVQADVVQHILRAINGPALHSRLLRALLRLNDTHGTILENRNRDVCGFEAPHGFFEFEPPKNLGFVFFQTL